MTLIFNINTMRHIVGLSNLTSTDLRDTITGGRNARTARNGNDNWGMGCCVYPPKECKFFISKVVFTNTLHSFCHITSHTGGTSVTERVYPLRRVSVSPFLMCCAGSTTPPPVHQENRKKT
jgi:hypothetical protein